MWNTGIIASTTQEYTRKPGFADIGGTVRTRAPFVAVGVLIAIVLFFLFGGSGGGAYGNTQVNNGGSNGGNGDPQNAANIGIDHWGSPGKGQGTTTREFGESTGTLYAGGGGAGGNGSAQAKGGSGGGGNGAWNGNPQTSGAANTGGGGGGMYYGLTNVGKGGSGIVVIRNHR